MMHQSLRVKYCKDPYLSLKLIGILAFSLICGVTAAAFPEKPRSELTTLDKILKSLAAAVTMAGGASAIVATIRDESQALEINCAQAVADHLTVTKYRSEGAYYRNNGMALRLGLPVPDEWHHDYAQTGEKYMQLAASSNPEVVLPQRPEPEAAPVSEARSLAETMMDPEFVELDRLGLIDDMPTKRPQAFYASKDRYAEVRSLVNEGTILIVGGQGSGKTEKLGWIMDSHCHQGHWVWFINPFAPAAHYKGLHVLGRGLNFKEAAEGLRAFSEEARRRIKLRGIDPNYDPFNELHIHLAIDELSDYENEIAKYDDTIMQGFWAVCTQFLRQANMSVSLVSHGDTQAMMGGGQQGKSKAIKRNIVRLYCQWKVDLSVKGGRRCAGWAKKVTLEADGREVFTRIDIPEWMVAPSDYNYKSIALDVKITSESDGQQQSEIAKPGIEIAETLAPQEFHGPKLKAETVSQTPEIDSQEASSPPGYETEITEREKEIFRILSNLGHTQTEIIKEIWNAKPGESKGYKESLAKYRILKEV